MSKFSDHLHSVDETYLQHLGHASGFGVRMLLGGLACLAHGLVPSLFATTGSRTIKGLHDRMVVNRTRKPAADGTLDFMI